MSWLLRAAMTADTGTSWIEMNVGHPGGWSCGNGRSVGATSVLFGLKCLVLCTNGCERLTRDVQRVAAGSSGDPVGIPFVTVVDYAPETTRCSGDACCWARLQSVEATVDDVINFISRLLFGSPRKRQ